MSFSYKRVIDRLRRYYERCNYIGIPTIRWNEGLLLYSIAYTYLTTNNIMHGYIVDAGAGAGFSTIWLVYAVTDAGTNHIVVAIDYYKRHLDMFRDLVEELGINIRIETIVGDACKILREYPDEVDILFLDVEKHRYIECLKSVKDRLKENALILAHNMLFPYTRTTEEYLQYVSRTLRWKTIIIPSEMGIGLAVKQGDSNCSKT